MKEEMKAEMKAERKPEVSQYMAKLRGIKAPQ